MNLFSSLFGKKAEASAPAEERRVEEPVVSKPVSQEAPQTSWNDASLKFLASFLSGAEFKEDQRSYWGAALGQTPGKLLQRLIDAGLLTAAPLAAKIEGAFKATEIKALLKERGLPVSGKKADAVARLVDADRTGMEAKVAHITAYICTASGRATAEGYLDRENERKRHARQRSFELLQSGQLQQACAAVAEYERAQVFPRGIGVDWNRRPSPEDILQLQAVLAAKPAILKDVSSSDWAILQHAAAMMELWGERSARAWLPAETIGASNLDLETAVRMVLFAGGHHAKLEQYRQAGCNKVEISGCGEASCPACQELGGKKYRITQVPELPHPACTHEMGCRCIAIPAFE